jgi:hypothetical protein
MGSADDTASSIEDSCCHNSCFDFSSSSFQAFFPPAHKGVESTGSIPLASGWKPSDTWQASPPCFLQVVEEVWGHHGAEVGICPHNCHLLTRDGKISAQGS